MSNSKLSFVEQQKYILSVDYNRMPLPCAYIKVVGLTYTSAAHRAKALGAILSEELPGSILRAPQYVGNTDKVHTFEVVLAISLCPIEKAKALIAKLILKGSL
jgi:hypothetical protein